MNENRAIAVENKYGVKIVMVCNKKAVADLVKMLEESPAECKCKVYDVNYENVPFEYLAEDIQKEVKDTLKVFDSCHVENRNAKMSVHAGLCISNSYASDECVIGEYKAKEIYTPEELKAAHKEVFGYAF